jgi:outer membrane protein TolC
MKVLRFLLFGFLITGSTGIVYSQQNQPAPEARVLGLRDLFNIVFEYHPVARQADLLSDNAKFRLRAARGSFDPSIHSYFDHKEFRGTNYFTVWQNELRVPTWFGFDLKAGYEMNNGTFLDPMLTVPDQGLFFAGISVPILQGLLIDQRRAVIRQAEIFTRIAEQDRLLMLNNLLLRVTTDYWDWMYQFNRFRLLQDGFLLAQIRYDAVRERVVWGDLAAIDSVEAAIEVQQRLQALDQSRIDYQNSMLRLSNHLWGENNTPLELTDNFLPQDELIDTARISLQDLELMINQSRQMHPIVQTYQFKLNQLRIERNYKANLLLPRLVVNLNALQHPMYFNEGNGGINVARFENNYKIGGSFSFPLFLRRQRNELKLANLYIQDTELELQQKSREISNKIRAVFNEMTNFENLMQTQESMVANYNILRDGEEMRFRNGESSLFLINTRERQLIESQVKFYEFRSKYALSTTKLVWEAGTLAGPAN